MRRPIALNPVQGIAQINDLCRHRSGVGGVTYTQTLEIQSLSGVRHRLTDHNQMRLRVIGTCVGKLSRTAGREQRDDHIARTRQQINGLRGQIQQLLIIDRQIFTGQPTPVQRASKIAHHVAPAQVQQRTRRRVLQQRGCQRNRVLPPHLRLPTKALRGSGCGWTNAPGGQGPILKQLRRLRRAIGRGENQSAIASQIGCSIQRDNLHQGRVHRGEGRSDPFGQSRHEFLCCRARAGHQQTVHPQPPGLFAPA